MCFLTAVSATQDIKPVNILNTLYKQHSASNRDGWGLVWYQNNRAHLIKEPLSASESKLADETSLLCKSKTLLCHLRNAGSGVNTLSNTQPFVRTLFDRDFTFILNGRTDSKQLPKIKLTDFKPDGETLAETIFCLFLENVKRQNIREWGEPEFQWIHSFFKDVNNYGNMSVIITNGNWVACYFDKDGYRSLYYSHQKFSTGKESGDGVQKHKSGAEGFIIATQPLSLNENWESFKPSQLLVFANGKIVFDSQKR